MPIPSAKSSRTRVLPAGEATTAGFEGDRRVEVFRDRVDPRAKRALKLSVRGDLVAAARAEGINLSALLEAAIERELARARRRRWHAENFDTVLAYNMEVLAHGTIFRRHSGPAA